MSETEAPQTEPGCRLLRQLVERAIDHRVSALYEQSNDLLNDMQSAVHRMDTQGNRASFGDIRIGAWQRASTELGVLQWFLEVFRTTNVTLDDIRGLLRQAVQQRITTMHRHSHEMMLDLQQTLREIDTDENGTYGDIRVGAWYKASTETRVLRWLVTSVRCAMKGTEQTPLDRVDDDLDDENSDDN